MDEDGKLKEGIALYGRNGTLFHLIVTPARSSIVVKILPLQTFENLWFTLIEVKMNKMRMIVLACMVALASAGWAQTSVRAQREIAHDPRLAAGKGRNPKEFFGPARGLQKGKTRVPPSIGFRGEFVRAASKQARAFLQTAPADRESLLRLGAVMARLDAEKRQIEERLRKKFSGREGGFGGFSGEVPVFSSICCSFSAPFWRGGTSAPPR